MQKALVAIALAALVVYLLNAISPENATKAIQPYQAEVAHNFEDQYAAVVAHGTMMDRCVRAGLVAEGYLQAADNVNFAKWADIKGKDCKGAGVPQ